MRLKKSKCQPQVNRILWPHSWVPTAVVALPEFHVPVNEFDKNSKRVSGEENQLNLLKPDRCNWEEGHSGVKGFAIHGVEEKALLFRIDERPKALGLLDHLIRTACRYNIVCVNHQVFTLRSFLSLSLLQRKVPNRQE